MSNLAISYPPSAGTPSPAALEETLALMKAKLGPDHPDTLISMSNLANGYKALGRSQACRSRGDADAAEGQARPRPPRHAHQHEQPGDRLRALNRHADALQLREETLALMKAKLGPDHPDTLATMNNLAISYEALGARRGPQAPRGDRGIS